MIRELNISEVREILGRNYIGYLAYTYMKSPYVVPMTYFYDSAEDYLIGYTSKGHKTQSMRLNPTVSVLVEEIDSLNDWKTVAVYGRFEELSGTTAKAALHKFRDGLKKLVGQINDKELEFLSDFSSKSDSEDPPIVYRIKVQEFTAKSRS